MTMECPRRTRNGAAQQLTLCSCPFLRKNRICDILIPSRGIAPCVLAGAPTGFLRRLLQPERVSGGEKKFYLESL